MGCVTMGVRLGEGCVTELTPLEFVEGVGGGGLLLQRHKYLLSAVDIVAN